MSREPRVDTLADAFSRPMFRALSQPAQSSGRASQVLKRMAATVGESVGPNATVGEAFDAAFNLLKISYRCEYYFKAQLISKIVFGRHSPRTASALLEFPMGASVADVLVVNGTTSVYEIKTDLDNFDRLESQLSQYGTRAEYTTVVVSDSRASQIQTVLPPWVGVLALRKNGALASVRPPISRLDDVVPEHQFQMLRTEEARRVVATQRDVDIKAPTGPAWTLLREEFQKMDSGQSNSGVVRELRKRGALPPLFAAADHFPQSLRALAYAQPLSRKAQLNILDELSAPLARYA